MGFVVKRLILLTLSACNPTIGFGFFFSFSGLEKLSIKQFALSRIRIYFFVPGQNCKRELV